MPHAPVFDLLVVIPALSSENVNQATQALNTLLNTPYSHFPKGLEGTAVPLAAGLTQAMYSSTPAMRLLAYRTVARLADQSEALQTALGSKTCSKALLSPLIEYHEQYDQILAATAKREKWLVEQAALATAKGGKTKGVVPTEPEPTVPGPEKELLDAALRALSTLVTCNPLASSRISSMPAAAFATLLKHPSVRIQYRSLRLMRMVVRHEGPRNGLVQVGVIGILLNILSTNLNAALKIEAAAIFSRLCTYEGPQTVMMTRGGLVSITLKLMLAPKTGVFETDLPSQPSTPPTAKGDKLAAPVPVGPPMFDFERPVATSPDMVQAAAINLLESLVTSSVAVADEVARLGGVPLISAFLPPCAAPALETIEETPVELRDTIFARMREEDPEFREEVQAQIEEEEADVYVISTELPLPATPASPQLLIPLLSILASVLALPHLQESLWRARRRSPLVPQLVNLLWAPAPVSPTPAQAPPPTTGAGGKSRKPSAGRKAQAAVQEAAPETTCPPALTAAALGALKPLTQHEELAKYVLHSTQFANLVRQIDDLDPAVIMPLATILQCLMPVVSTIEPPAASKDRDDYEPLLQSEMAQTTKALAAAAVDLQSSLCNHAVSRAALLLTDDVLIAEPRPPLPSPPATPPPPPLATAMYIWDALGRPIMTDGVTFPCVT